MDGARASRHPLARRPSLPRAPPHPHGHHRQRNPIRCAPRYADGPTARYMTRMFALRYPGIGIEHRCIKNNHLWMNGQVARMSGASRTPPQALPLRQPRLVATTPHGFVAAYNFARRLRRLRGLIPYEFTCRPWAETPERFSKNPHQQMPGLNTSGGTGSLRLRVTGMAGAMAHGASRRHLLGARIGGSFCSFNAVHQRPTRPTPPNTGDVCG